MLECEREKEERINKNPPPSFVFLGGGCHFLFFWSSVKLLNEQNYRRECEIMPKSKPCEIYMKKGKGEGTNVSFYFSLERLIIKLLQMQRFLFIC